MPSINQVNPEHKRQIELALQIAHFPQADKENFVRWAVEHQMSEPTIRNLIGGYVGQCAPQDIIAAAQYVQDLIDRNQDPWTDHSDRRGGTVSDKFADMLKRKEELQTNLTLLEKDIFAERCRSQAGRIAAFPREGVDWFRDYARGVNLDDAQIEAIVTGNLGAATTKAITIASDFVDALIVKDVIDS